MRLTTARALGTAVLCGLVAGVSTAAAGPKFVFTETIQFPGGNLVVTFDEGGQKRYSFVDYRLAATADVTSCTTVGDVTQCSGERRQLADAVSDLVPDDKGRVAGTLTLVFNAGGGTICGCTLHMDYSNITLTNLTSDHVYRLEPISADGP